MWFAEIFIEEIREGCIILNVASEHTADFIKKNMSRCSAILRREM